MLTSEDLQNIERLLVGIGRVKDAISRLNDFAIQSGLPLRQVESHTLGLMGNDISMLMAEDKRARAAMQAEALERMAA